MLGRSDAFATRAPLFNEGEVAEHVYSVTSGAVRLFRLLSDGRCRVLGFAMAGDFVGLPLEGHHRYSADAAGPATACRFSRSAFASFANTRPQLLLGLYDSAARGLDLAYDQMTMIGPAQKRLAAFLLWLRRRRSRVSSLSVLVGLPMKRQDIADFLGLTVFTVSRVLNRLARQRVIVIVPGGIRIIDPPRLERLAQD